MCGIVGVLSFGQFSIGWRERKIFQEMLIADALRGTDGTGAFIVDDSGVCRNLKIGSVPYDLLNAPEWKRFDDPYPTYNANNPKDLFLVGHNRAASVGSVTTKNAHPFVHGSVTMVHNGTLREYSKLPRMSTFDVDSEALCHGISKLGIREAIQNSYGAWAIVSYDEDTRQIQLVRNSQRPLAMAIDGQDNIVYFASEPYMLKWILVRNSADRAASNIAMIKEDTLLTYSMGNPIPAIEPLEGPKVQSHRYTPHWHEEVEAHHLSTAFDNGTSEKKISKILKKINNMGIVAEVLDSVFDTKRNDFLTFRLTDYIEEDPKAEKFILIGENPTMPRTAIKFRVKSMAEVERMFDNPKITARVKNIVRYPEAPKDEDEHTIWVTGAECQEPGNYPVTVATTLQ